MSGPSSENFQNSRGWQFLPWFPWFFYRQTFPGGGIHPIFTLLLNTDLKYFQIFDKKTVSRNSWKGFPKKKILKSLIHCSNNEFLYINNFFKAMGNSIGQTWKNCNLYPFVSYLSLRLRIMVTLSREVY